jgi:hypothetical protein
LENADNRDSSAIPVTRGGGYGGIESPDGAFHFYTKAPLSGPIWRVPAGGGDETAIGEDIRSLRLPQNFAVGQGGLYFAASERPSQVFEIRFYSFATKTTRTIRRIERGLGNGMYLAPDGKTLLFSTMELNSGDLFLISNFR